MISLLRKPFRYTYIKATLYIIAINVLVFLLFRMPFMNDKIGIIFEEEGTLFGLRFNDLFGINEYGLTHKLFLWQPVTYMFMHGNWTHLFFNMLGLFMFGLTVERYLGSKEFVLFYLLTGILSGVLSVFINHFIAIQTIAVPYKDILLVMPRTIIGASGVLYGMLLMYAVMFPKQYIYVWGLLPVKAPYLVLIYAAIEFFGHFSGSDGISHITHLCGFAVTWLYLLVRMGINPIRVWFKN